ncbi:MAG: folate family ECF transporter S component [Clostridia bacterium]|nr:folate family ECF transporter S component [Clostridia bacterium]
MKKTSLRNTKVLAISAFTVALSVLIGWVCKSYLTFGDGSVRLTFENIPIILSGIWFGPAVGLAVGASSDVISALLSGYSINPIITVGSAFVGVVSGVLSSYVIKEKKGFLSYLIISVCAHTVGSVIIKSYGLWLYGYAVLMQVRIPLYIVISVTEAYIIYIISKNTGVRSGIERLLKK